MSKKRGILLPVVVGEGATPDVTRKTYSEARTECAVCRRPMVVASPTDAALVAALVVVTCDDCRGRETR